MLDIFMRCNVVVIVIAMINTTHQTAPKIAKRPDRGERVVRGSEGNTEDDEEEVWQLKYNVCSYLIFVTGATGIPV